MMNYLFVKHEDPMLYRCKTTDPDYVTTPNTVTKEELEFCMGIRGSWPYLWTSVPKEENNGRWSNV